MQPEAAAEAVRAELASAADVLRHSRAESTCDFGAEARAGRGVSRYAIADLAELRW